MNNENNIMYWEEEEMSGKYSKFRWYVLLMVFVATAAQGMVLISPSPLVGEISKSMGLSLGEVTGAAMGAFTMFVALSGVAGGIISDKFGVAKTYIVSISLMIIGALLMPVFGGTIGGLVALRIIQGLGAGPVIATISKIAAEWFPAKERAIVTGVQGTALSLGIAIGFGAAPAIFASSGSWQTAMAGMASLSVVALIMTIIFAFGPKPVVSAESVSSEAIKSGTEAFKLALKLPVFWIGFISVFALSWVQQGYNDLTPGHLAVEAPVGLDMGSVAAGQIMGIYQIAFMLGSMASGFLIQKFFEGKIKRLIAVCFLLTGIFATSVLLTPVNSNTTLLFIVLLIAGFFMGMPNPAVMAFIASSYPEDITGRIGGMTMGLGIFGGTAGVAVGSIALHATGMYTISILVVGVVCLLGVVNAWQLNPPVAFKQAVSKNAKDAA